MTTNQLKWAEISESRRHNVTSETETTRHNLATEEVASNTLAETQRHNQVSEETNWFTAQNNAGIGWANAASNAKQAAAAQTQAAASLQNAQTQAAAQVEMARHNLVEEEQLAGLRGSQANQANTQAAVNTANVDYTNYATSWLLPSQVTANQASANANQQKSNWTWFTSLTGGLSNIVDTMPTVTGLIPMQSTSVMGFKP